MRFAAWTRASHFAAITALEIKHGSAELLAFVRSTGGVIGYIGRTAAGVKVLQSL